MIIDEGKFDDKNVERTGRDTKYYLDILKKNGCQELKKVLVLTVDGNGKMYFQQKGEKYKVINLNWGKTLW